MKLRSLMTAICVLATANVVSAAPFAYVANSGTRNVSVIDTADDTVKATIALPDTQPTVHPYAYGVAVGASGQNVYVGLQDTNEVAVIDAATNSVIKRIGLGGDSPSGLAVNDAETRLYVTSNLSNTLIVIDISNGAAEVGRVAVDATPVSNPSGVVLNAAGNMAYVANTSTGNIAVVSLDEASNVYSLSSTIALGGTQPLGLSLNPAGTMLYASSLSGDLRAIKLSDSSITNLKTNNGTVALAVKPDGSKVYAPSNSVDTLYVVDSSVTPNVVLGTSYPVAAGPFGISITPDGSKLYMTMNISTAGETVKVFNTTSNTVTSTIALPAGAKPISFGNFVGPVFPYTITATNGANCVISPVGVVPVNAKGRSFTSSAITGNCEVKVDGVSVGLPTSYDFAAVTGNHTIDSSQLAGTYYTVSGDWISIVGACVSSTPNGINCASKSAKFLSGSTVTLKATTGYSVKSGTWGGDCAGQGGTCTLTMNADKSFGTTVQFVAGGTGPFYNVTKASYNSMWSDAASSAAGNDYIKFSNDNTSITTDGPAGVMINASNQWLQSDYNTHGPYVPMTLTITNVGITILNDTMTL